MPFSALSEGPYHVIAHYAGPCTMVRLRMSARWCELSEGLQVRSCAMVWPDSYDGIQLLSTIDPSPERLDALWITLSHRAANKPNEPSAEWEAKTLDLAVGAGRGKPCVSTCRLLLASRADPNSFVKTPINGARSGGSPLLTAILHGSQPIVDLLLMSKADPNGVVQYGSRDGDLGDACPHYSHRPLELASRAGCLPMVRTLLDYGADVNAISGQPCDKVQADCTALLAACDRCHLEIFQDLLKRGADPDLECKDHNTETGTRSVRDTLAWMMGFGDARNFQDHPLAGGSSGYPTEKLYKLFDLLSEADDPAAT